MSSEVPCSARAELPFRRRWFAPWALMVWSSCGTGTGSLSGEATHAEASRYIRKAVQSSSEGVILLPSRKATTAYDSATLGDLAQGLRVPLAQCFLERAIETMERGVVDGEETFVRVPEGQAKIRARLGADGTVQRAEILETGFLDVVMEDCVLAKIQELKFPPPGEANLTYVDVVYWVSLGFNPSAHSPEAKLDLRKAQVKAGLRAKQCLQGRVEPGRYTFEGLNLIGREGGTLINRINSNDASPELSACVAQALKALTLSPERESFVRPVEPAVTFVVADSGSITVEDEEWLRVLELEEQAQREALREELAAEQAPPPSPSEQPATQPGMSFGTAATPVVPSSSLPAHPPAASATETAPEDTAPPAESPPAALDLTPRAAKPEQPPKGTR